MTARTSPVILTPLVGFPEVVEGDDLAGIVLKALQGNGIQLLDGDILVVSSKVASKAMGLSAPFAHRAGVVLSQTVRVVAERMTPSGVTRIVESAAGPVMAAAGVDASNTGDGSIVLILPGDPDAVAREIREGVQSGWAARSGDHIRVGVVLSDTAGRPWRIGQTDFALGAAGIHVIEDLRGSGDADGRALSVTERCVGDEIAAAADLVKGKTTGVPAAHIRGLGQYVHDGESTSDAKTSSARDLIRTGPGDWFSLGQAEAVRAALGVAPGTAEAAAVGIPSMNAETVAFKASRALRVALVACPDASGQVDGDTVRITAPDDFTLGVAVTRAEVALRGEGLATTLTRTPSLMPTPTAAPAENGLTPHSSALIVFQ
jgi:coenzyme F420-0:L-glutamate ligase / coenzyme F420-1:gamma-L-glutamate ligase